MIILTTKEQFSTEVRGLSNRGAYLLDAVQTLAARYDIEAQVIGQYLSDDLKQDLLKEARGLNLIKRDPKENMGTTDGAPVSLSA